MTGDGHVPPNRRNSEASMGPCVGEYAKQSQSIVDGIVKFEVSRVEREGPGCGTKPICGRAWTRANGRSCKTKPIGRGCQPRHRRTLRCAKQSQFAGKAGRERMGGSCETKPISAPGPRRASGASGDAHRTPRNKANFEGAGSRRLPAASHRGVGGNKANWQRS